MTAFIESLAFVCALFATVAALSLALGRRAGDAPALTLFAGLCVALAADALGVTPPSIDFAAGPAGLGLAALSFAAAAQLRLRALFRRNKAAFRLAAIGAPLCFGFWALSAFVMLPQTTAATAGLIAAALLLDGAAFDRAALAAAPAPASVKRATRLECAAIAAIGAPIAILCLGAATAAGPGEPAAAPLFFAALSMLKGFLIGGVCGLGAALLGDRLVTLGRRWSLTPGEASAVRAGAAIAGGLAACLGASLLGGNVVVAAAAAGLLWSEQMGREQAPPDIATWRPNARRRLQRLAERTVTPAAYFAFGFLLAPRLAEADLLTVMFAVAATTILRAAPRLMALKRATLPAGGRNFLAWYGGAPGAGTALFLIMLTGEPAVAGLDAALTVGALCVACGVVGARASSKPLLDGFLQSAARGRRRAAFA